jgi:hypothetical protein
MNVEGNMARDGFQGRRNLGLALLVLGTAVMLRQAGMVIWHVYSALNDSVGPLRGLGFGSMHAMQRLAFDSGVAGLILRWILLSFTALVGTVIGIALLKRDAGLTDGRASTNSPAGGGLPWGERR